MTHHKSTLSIKCVFLILIICLRSSGFFLLKNLFTAIFPFLVIHCKTNASRLLFN